MRKAGRLEIGETNTGAAVRDGRAKLVLVAADASDNARKRADGYLMGHRALLVPLPYTKDDLSELLGKGGCSMAAVTDIGLAEAFVSALADDDPARYGETAQEIGRRNDRAVKRRAKGPKANRGGSEHE
ncbi:MAG: 50S ribosomal protein L7 [Clostridia bacterium]|nr:50S ribosomal protein L7 [Clostridia bacterium]NCC69185.1 50S ribosomal protein L7 [Clostridia bacterium]